MPLKGHFPRYGECPFSVVMVKKIRKIKGGSSMNNTELKADGVAWSDVYESG